jgi:hypothetical protein
VAATAGSRIENTAIVSRDELSTLREARATIMAWLEGYRTAPDPTSQGAARLRELSYAVRRADSAIRDVAPGVRSSGDWKAAMADYGQALEALRELLADYDVRLRVRRDQLRRASARLGAVRCWAQLAKVVG